MRWISQFYDGGRSSEIVAMTDDADGIWRVLDTVTGHESILDLRKGQVSWSPSGVLLAPVGAVILPQTGAALEAQILDRLFDAKAGQLTEMSLDQSGRYDTTYNVLTVNETTLIVSPVGSSTMFVLHRHPGSGQIAVVYDFTDPALADITKMTATEGGRTDRFYAVSAQSDALVGYSIAPDGALTQDFFLGKDQGFPIDLPNALISTQIDGTQFLITGAFGTNSLTVVAIDEFGDYEIRDHIVDDRFMRFDDVSIVETLRLTGRTFVVAAGNDGGITLFELLRDGRLIFSHQWISSAAYDIGAIEYLKINIYNNDLIFTLKQRDELITQVYAVDIADVLSGATIYSTGQASGGSGNDIIIDSNAADILWGGQGSDVFVIAQDGVADTILDFDLDRDIIDLSFWSLLYSVDQLKIEYGTNDISITFGSEHITIIPTPDGAVQALGHNNFRFAAHYSVSLVDQNPISQTQDPDPLGKGVLMAHSAGVYTLPQTDPHEDPIASQTLLPHSNASFEHGVKHLLETWKDGASPTPQYRVPDIFFIGSSADDFGVGGAGADNLLGLAGNDQLYGGLGADTIQGGTGHDQLFGGSGDDILVGGMGNDYLYGGQGADSFVFFPVESQDFDIISDFDVSIDQIQIQHSANFGVIDMSDLDIHDVTGGLWIDLWGSVIQLLNVHSSDLSAQNFEFTA